MHFFTAVEDGQAIIHSKGVYRQVPIYVRADKVYAKYGGGFVRLAQGGATSAPNVRWAEIDPGLGAYHETKGQVLFQPEPGNSRKAINMEAAE